MIFIDINEVTKNSNAIESAIFDGPMTPVNIITFVAMHPFHLITGFIIGKKDSPSSIPLLITSNGIKLIFLVDDLPPSLGGSFNFCGQQNNVNNVVSPSLVLKASQ